MFDEATEVGDELELTRPDLDRWALRSHQLAIKATDEGRLPEEIVPVTIKSRKGDTVVEIDEAPRRDIEPRGARQAPGPDLARRARTRPATRRASTTVAARWCWLATSGRAEQRQAVLATVIAQAAGRRRLRLSRAHTGQGRVQGAREGRLRPGRGRSVGDQRGVRLGHAELDPDARDRRGQGQRQRRRGRARSSDRRVRRADHRRAGATSCAAAAAGSAAPRSAPAAARATR